MWKLKFYNIIAKVDQFKETDQGSFHKVVDSIYNDILSLQLILVNRYQNTTQYSTAHLISFALSAYCDERLNLLALSMGYDYVMLQTKLFNTISAGKIFYEYLEYLLAEPSAQVNTYWVYYYLLLHGYKGIYDLDSNFQKSLYLRQLKLALIEKSESNSKEPKKRKQGYRGIISRFRVPLSLYWLVPSVCLLLIYILINYSL